jgi:hypothetical protein
VKGRRRPLAAGHELAFGADKLDLLLPFSRAPNYDTWIAQFLAAAGRIALLDEMLVSCTGDS